MGERVRGWDYAWGLCAELFDETEHGAVEDGVPGVGLLREQVVVPEERELAVVSSCRADEVVCDALRASSCSSAM